MRFVCRVLFVAVLFSPVAKADDMSEMRAFQNFDKRIQSLESYSVTYTEPGKKAVQIKAAKSVAQSEDEVTVELVPARPAKRLIAGR